MFQAQLSCVVNLSNVFLVWLPDFYLSFVNIPVAPFTSGIIIHFTFHIRCISTHQLFYFIIIIIIIIVIIIFVISVQGIYNYIPETNHVSRVYSVAAVLYLQSVLHVMLFRVLTL